MKKHLALLTIVAFLGVSAFSLNKMYNEDSRTADNKTECTRDVVQKASCCDAATNVVLTSGTEKSSPCGSAAKAVTASGTEKASPCGSSDKTEKTAGAEKPAGCSSPCGTAITSQQTAVSGNCSSEKSEDERVAERN